MNLKQKNIVLIISFLLFIWLAYLFSFSKTMKLKRQYAKLKEEVSLFENSSQRLLLLQKENKYYDSILKSKRISTEQSFQNNLLTTINIFADTTNIRVVSFQNPHVFQDNGTDILTYSFTVRGYFNEITRLIYGLEQTFKLGKVISVSYRKKRDFRRRSDYLECTILLQRINS